MRATPSMRNDAAEIHARMPSRDALCDRSEAVGLSAGLFSCSPTSSVASAQISRVSRASCQEQDRRRCQCICARLM